MYWEVSTGSCSWLKIFKYSHEWSGRGNNTIHSKFAYDKRWGILNMWKAELESQMVLTNWRDHLKKIGLSSIVKNAKC